MNRPLRVEMEQTVKTLILFTCLSLCFIFKSDLELQTRMSLQCGTMEKEGFLLLHRTKDKCMPMTSPFKKYYVTLSKDTLSYSRTQHSKVGRTDGLILKG